MNLEIVFNFNHHQINLKFCKIPARLFLFMRWLSLPSESKNSVKLAASKSVIKRRPVAPKLKMHLLLYLCIVTKSNPKSSELFYTRMKSPSSNRRQQFNRYQTLKVTWRTTYFLQKFYNQERDVFECHALCVVHVAWTHLDEWKFEVKTRTPSLLQLCNFYHLRVKIISSLN